MTTDATTTLSPAARPRRPATGAPTEAGTETTTEAATDVVRVRLRVPGLVAAGVGAVLAPHRSRVEVVPDGDREPVHVEVFDPLTHGTAVQPSRMERLPLVALVHPLTRESEARARGLGAHRVLGLDVPAVELVRSLEEVCRPVGDAIDDEAEEPPTDAALSRLSPRELEVLGHISRGRSNDEIAEALYLSVNSVKTYVRLAYRKIGVNTRPHAVIWALEHGLTPED